jgi:hypothetical protein
MSSLTGNAGMAGEIIPKGYQKGRLSQFNPQQTKLFQTLFGLVGPDSQTGQLAGGDEEAFQQMEAPAYRDFNSLQGNIASRFSGMGLGGRHSSGFQNTATAAGSNFAQDLQSRRSELQRQAIKDLMGMSSELLGQRPYEDFLVEKPQKQSFWGDIFGKAASAVPSAAMGFLGGGPAGALGAAGASFLGSPPSQASSGSYGLPTFMNR